MNKGLLGLSVLLILWGSFNAFLYYNETTLQEKHGDSYCQYLKDQTPMLNLEDCQNAVDKWPETAVKTLLHVGVSYSVALLILIIMYIRGKKNRDKQKSQGVKQ